MNKKNVQEDNCKIEGKGKSFCTTKSNCKAKLVFVIAIVLAVGAYVGFWHYQAGIIKANVEQRLSNPAFNELTYESVAVTGFPFKYNVEVQKPSMQFDYMGQPFKLEMDKVAIVSKIGDMKRYKANLGNITISGDYVGKNGESENIVETFKFRTPPVIEVELEDGADISTLSSVSYNDRGFSVEINGKKVGSVEKMNASFAKGDLEGNQHFFKINGSYQIGKPADIKELPMIVDLSKETTEKLLEMSKKFGKANADFDITLTYTGPKDLNMDDPTSLASLEAVHLDIGKISFKTQNSLGYEISGNIKMDKSSLMPSVDLKLGLFSVDEAFAFVNDFVKIMPEIMEQSQNPNATQEEKDANLAVLESLKSVDEKSLENVKTFLYEISDNPAEKTKDLTISVKSLEDGGFMVGTLNASQVEEVFKNRFSGEGTNLEASEPEATMEVAPEIDVISEYENEEENEVAPLAPVIEEEMIDYYDDAIKVD